MADAGDLALLPLELRKEIYTYLLIEDKKIGIMKYGSMLSSKVARMDNHINPGHRGKVYDIHRQRWVAAPYRKTALLHVNKATCEEAKQVLYGDNHFEFQHAGALLGFLKSIGESSARYLHHVSIIGNGVLQKFKWDEMDRALARLTQAKGLRSLEVSHLAICGKPNMERCHKIEITELVTHFKPLLQVLHAEFKNAGLKMRVFDAIKITLPPCACSHTNKKTTRRIFLHPAFGPLSLGPPYRRIAVTQRSRSGNGQNVFECTCLCTTADGKNERLVQELKEEIARQLNLQLDNE